MHDLLARQRVYSAPLIFVVAYNLSERANYCAPVPWTAEGRAGISQRPIGRRCVMTSIVEQAGYLQSLGKAASTSLSNDWREIYRAPYAYEELRARVREGAKINSAAYKPPRLRALQLCFRALLTWSASSCRHVSQHRRCQVTLPYVAGHFWPAPNQY